MQDLAELLARSGMAPGTRHLVYLTVAVGLADHDAVEGAIASARGSGLPRTELEEALLQSALFFGFPRAVSAFERLVAVWPAPAPKGGGLPPEQWRQAGEELFASIYGANAASVRTMLAGFHRDFHDFVLESAYGRILARPALAPRVRELMAVAALVALDQVPQMVAHGRGALALGASPEEVREAVFTARPAIRECERLTARILRAR